MERSGRTPQKAEMINYALLISVSILTYLSIRRYEFYPIGIYDKSLDPYRLLTPGVWFSLYVVFLQRKNWTFRKLTLCFFILFVLYCASLGTALGSWGITVPFAGGIGALLIKQLFNNKTEWLDTNGKRYLSIGFIAGVIGLVLFYVVVNAWAVKVGVGFAFILIIWQFAIGILWIKQIGTSASKA